MLAQDLNCPLSHRLLLRIIGDGILEVQSKYCKKRILFDTFAIRKHRKKPEVLDPVSEEEKKTSQKNRANLAR